MRLSQRLPNARNNKATSKVALLFNLERVTRFELVTSTLARSRSTS